ncbi:hypothetical protein FA15DRAFT_674160 [Coprinopsis marcescibilis]|uniref:F-box domain-containing protein n=1 Tax=Coprinopsis marcescibilis TaxID=230819 RepID=A0A5C3KI36_COPMA|nr:hypothetical protein FA15DRAFT_674160 [Coprinopsis marcescibilis]
MTHYIPPFPLELIMEIVDSCELSDLPRIATSFRGFHAACTRRIYRDIVLWTRAAAQRCMQTIALNYQAARYVRSLSIPAPLDRNGSWHNTDLSVFYRHFRGAIKSISPNLITLKLEYYEVALNTFSTLNRLSFPRLLHFRTSEFLTPQLGQFLLANPQLKTLKVNGLTTRRPHEQEKRRFTMPDLTELHTDEKSLHLFLPGSKVRTVYLRTAFYYIGGPQPRPAAKLVELLALSPVPIKWLSMSLSTYSTEVFRYLGKLTHLTALILDDEPTGFGDYGIDTAVNDMLPSLTSLRYLGIRDKNVERRLDRQVGTSKDFADLRSDYEVICGWAKLQASLISISIDRQVHWAQLKVSGQWIPLESNSAHCLLWWYEASGLAPHLRSHVLDLLQRVDLTVLDDPNDSKRVVFSLLARVLINMIHNAFSDVHQVSNIEDRSREGVYQVLHLPEVRNANGEALKAYADADGKMTPEVKERWDRFFCQVGFVAISCTTEFQVKPAQSYFYTGQENPLPLGADGCIETFSFLLSVIWSSISGIDISPSRFVRNAEGEMPEWDSLSMKLDTVDFHLVRATRLAHDVKAAKLLASLAHRTRSRPVVT